MVILVISKLDPMIRTGILLNSDMVPITISSKVGAHGWCAQVGPAADRLQPSPRFLGFRSLLCCQCLWCRISSTSAYVGDVGVMRLHRVCGIM